MPDRPKVVLNYDRSPEFFAVVRHIDVANGEACVINLSGRRGHFDYHLRAIDGPIRDAILLDRSSGPSCLQTANG